MNVRPSSCPPTRSTRRWPTWVARWLMVSGVAATALEVQVQPDRADWLYATGQPVVFTVRVTDNGHELPNASVRYTVGEEQKPAPELTAEVPAGGLAITGGTLDRPGFLRCTVTCSHEGRSARGMATVGFDPERLEATQVNPPDFDAFWSAGKAELADIPLDPQLTPQPDWSTDRVEVFHISFQNIRLDGAPGYSRMYGTLCVPRERVPHPAVLLLPGAGVYRSSASTDLAAKGFITLELGIHGLPVNLPAETYAQLRSGALNGYQFFNLDDRRQYYYRRVFLGCLRAVDFLCGRPEYDGRNLGVMGSSQGGLLSLVVAALDPRVSAYVSIHPAYSDVTAYLPVTAGGADRAGGWPHLFRPRGNGTPNAHATLAKIAVTGYYDAVNFARRVKVPGYFAWGFNDEVCPPTSVYCAYNACPAPRTLALAPEAGHTVSPAQYEEAQRWLETRLRGTLE
jgi:cephalosporin-C deacetylase